jgi:hypothetical protein
MRNLPMLLVALFVSVGLSAADIDEYVYSRGGSQTTAHINNFSLQTLNRLPKGHYFWFRDEGASFMIRDVATLAVIDRVFEEAHKLAPEEQALRKRMRPVERRQSELEDEIDRLDEEIDEIEDKEERLSAADRDRMRALRDRQRPLEDTLRSVEEQLRELEREEERLDQRTEALEREAERKLVPIMKDAIRRGVAVRSELY